MSFFSRITQIPIEIAICLFLPWLMLLDFDCVNYRFEKTVLFIFVLGILLWVIRHTSFQPKVKRISSFGVGLCGLFLLSDAFLWLSFEVVVCLFALSLVLLLGFRAREDEDFCLFYRCLSVDFVKALACSALAGCIGLFVEEVVVNVSMGPDNRWGEMVALITFIFCFSFFQTKKEEERMPIYRDPGFWLNMLLALFLLGCICLRAYYAAFYYHFIEKTVVIFICLALFVLSSHLHLFTIRKSPKSVQIVLRVVNAIAILFYVVYYFLFLPYILDESNIFMTLLVFVIPIFIIPVLFLHVSLFYKVRWSLRCAVVLSGLLFALPLIFGYAIRDWKAYSLCSYVEEFAEEYHMLDVSKKYNRIGEKRPPVEAIRDPRFSQFMLTRELLRENGCLRFDAVPMFIKEYSLVGDSVRVETIYGDTKTFSIPQYEWSE